MEPGSKRWVEITPSQYAHERGGLAAIRDLLPDADPYRAWSNFTFTTRSGRQYEVDLLVLGRGGLYLLELKHWSGTVTGDHQTWFHNGIVEDNPRILADSKAKHFKELLCDVGGRDVPFVHAGVVLHNPDAQVRLTERGRKGVYRIDGQGPAGLAELVRDVLAAVPRDPRDVIDRRRAADLARLIERAGVRRSARHRKVGTMVIDDDPIAEGPGWQDHLARHPMLERPRRVRFYLVGRAASAEERTAILRAAQREFVTLENLNHPGVARALEFYEHERGPAVVFEHDPSETRLDHFLQQQGDALTVDDRIDLVRTLTHTLRYAHSRRLVHRRLSPLSVYVRTLSSGRYGVRVRDWHMTGRLLPGATGHVAGTRTLEAFTDQGAHGYLAPETLHNPAADAILADVFGLGAIAYLIFTGKPPAATGEALRQRLAREGGLDETASAWPGNVELGQAADVTAGRVGQILPKARKGWRQRPALTEVRNEIVDLVAEVGGVLSAEGIAEALLTSRGSEAVGDQRLRRALGLVRAAVEVEGERGGEARLLHRRSHHLAIVALENSTDPDAVPGTDLLDYAVRLGKAADRLAGEDPLPSAARTEDRLREVRPPDGMAELPAERLAALAAAASERAAANGRGEIYPRGMDPRRTLEQLASALGVIRHGMTAEQLKARVRARYPKAAPLPGDPSELAALLQAARVPLVFDEGVYRPRDVATGTLPASYWSRTRTSGPAADRHLADFERRLEVSLAERGFVTLGVDHPRYLSAIPALRDRFGVTVVDVTAELLAAMRATAGTCNVDWSIVLRADRPDASRQDAANLHRLVEMAAAGLERRLREDPAPLLIVEAAPLARYGRLAVLEELADKATGRPAARWLLVPVDRDGRPYLDDHPAPGALGSLRLSTTWLDQHRRRAVS